TQPPPRATLFPYTTLFRSASGRWKSRNAVAPSDGKMNASPVSRANAAISAMLVPPLTRLNTASTSRGEKRSLIRARCSCRNSPSTSCCLTRSVCSLTRRLDEPLPKRARVVGGRRAPDNIHHPHEPPGTALRHSPYIDQKNTGYTEN